MKSITPYDYLFLLLLPFPRNLSEILRNSEQKKYFTDHRPANTVQVFVAIKGNFSGPFYFWTSRRKDKFLRDYLINAVKRFLVDKKLSKSDIRKIALAAIHYFGEVFVLFRLINKKVLEWFVPIICKEHILTRSTNLLNRNHPTLCFWLRREGWQKLILNHLIENNNPELCNGLLDSFSVTYFQIDFRKWLLKTLFIGSRFQNYPDSVISQKH